MYYKITNKDEIHFGYEYKDGLNIDTKDGMYFTDKQNLYNFLQFGIYIRKVTIPRGIKIIKDTSFNTIKWKAKQIILGEKINLYDLNTFIEFKMYLHGDALIYICNNSAIPILDWCYDNCSSLPRINRDFNDDGYIEIIINNACKSGNIIVLDWFHSKEKIKYKKRFIALACEFNQIVVLEWFYSKFGSEFKYDEKSIKVACINSNTMILDWLYTTSRNLFCYNNTTLNMASITILDWFYTKADLPFRYCQDTINYAAMQNKVEILEWFYVRKFTICYDMVLYYACAHNSIAVLEWVYLNNSIRFNFNSDFISGCDTSIKDWFNKNIELISV